MTHGVKTRSRLSGPNMEARAKGHPGAGQGRQGRRGGRTARSRPGCVDRRFLKERERGEGECGREREREREREEERVRE